MFDQGHNSVSVLENELRVAMEIIVTQGSQFYSLRVKVREIALEYPEFIIWSPELRDDQAVSDIWDRSHTQLASVSVQASQEMIDAPMWLYLIHI